MTAKLANGDMVDSLPYLITLPLYIILVIIQLLIFLHFAIKTHGLYITRIIRYFALSIGLIVLCTLLLELWSILVDLSSTLPKQNNVYCFIQNYFRFISFIVLECTLFTFWVIRLQHTFNGSILALSNKLTYSMFIGLPFLTIIFLVICAISIQPRYFKINLSFNSTLNNIGYGCTTLNNMPILIFFIGSQFIAIVFNIFFAYFFYYKLKKFVEIICNQSHRDRPHHNIRQNAISVLMQKHTLLALITVCSAIISYVTFDILLYIYNGFIWQFAFLFIDIDMVIKTCTCFLMFKFYENAFFSICCGCIKIAAMPRPMMSCKCCNCNDTNNNNIDKYTSLFEPLYIHSIAKKAKSISSGLETAAYSDEYGEDRVLFKASSSGITTPINNRNQNQTQNIMTVTAAEQSEEYVLANYTFNALLAKVKMDMTDNNVNQRIFQYAMRNEKIEDQDLENIFNKIDKQYNLFGNFKDIFYYKNNECKFPFTVAIKLETESVKDGNILSKYVSKRIGYDTLNKLSTIKDFNYEQLLEQIITEIKSKNVDITGIRLSSSPSNKNKNKNKNKKKSKQKIIPLPKLDIINKKHDIDGNHTPINVAVHSPDKISLINNNAYDRHIQTANQIQMSYR